jgi:hypothetical protein
VPRCNTLDPGDAPLHRRYSRVEVLEEDGQPHRLLGWSTRQIWSTDGGIHGVGLTHRTLVSFCLGEPAREVVDSAQEFLGVSERLIKVQHISGDTDAAAVKWYRAPGNSTRRGVAMVPGNNMRYSSLTPDP